MATVDPDSRLASGSPTTDQFLAAAAAAAPRWGFEPTSIDILSHSENVVCDVSLPDDRHAVLRLHRPGYNSLDELRSEVAWVEALAAYGLPVPQPVATVDGDHYCPISVGTETRQVGVIEWVGGQPVGGVRDGSTPDVVRHYGRIGEIAARIRIHNDAWEPPVGFTRRRWDTAGLVGDDPLWGRFWEIGALSAEQRSLFAEARVRLADTLGSLSTGPDRFGLIHADLHLGNVMADGDELTVIDFDDSGFGWYVHELAVALHPVLHETWFEAARDALIGGYRRVHDLDDDEAGLIDAFVTVRCLMIVGWLDARPELPMHEHFAEVAGEAETATRRFLASEGR